MRYFIMMIFASASRKIEYPLIEFIKKFIDLELRRAEAQTEQFPKCFY